MTTDGDRLPVLLWSRLAVICEKRITSWDRGKLPIYQVDLICW